MSETGISYSSKQKKLHFADEFGWIDQQSDQQPMTEDDLEFLHERTKISIRLCNCRRCLRWKCRKCVDEKSRQLGRDLTLSEKDKIFTEVYNKTRQDRHEAGL